MALDRPIQGGAQPTQLNHSGFKSPPTIQPYPPPPPPPNIMPQGEHAKAHNQDRKYVALSTIAVTIRRYPRYRPAMGSVCKNGPTNQGTNGPRLTFQLTSALEDNNAAYIIHLCGEKCGASKCQRWRLTKVT